MEETQLSFGEIIGLATDKVNLGRQLMNNLKNLLDIEGVRRIKEQISTEVHNLLIAINEGTISIKVIHTSKLLHLECLVKILLKCRGLTTVDYVLPAEESETDPMRVDIVCENGACSVNVEAKNLHTLTNSLNESGGHQRILNQAEEFVEAATSNPEVPKPPQMCLIFDNELDQGQSKIGMDDSLLDFVNSIVRMDQTDRQWEFHLNNTSQAEVIQTVEEPEDAKQKDNREYKRIQMQQRRANPIIRSAENDRKRQIKLEKRELEGLGPPRKYQKRDSNELLNANEEEGDANLIGTAEVDPLEISDREYKTEGEQEGAVYQLVQQEEEGEPQTVVVIEQANGTYSESQHYFCDSCKETGSVYEQEILRLREELKQKNSIINSLKSLIGSGEGRN